MKQFFRHALQQAGISSQLLDVRRVSGGSINEAYVAQTEQGSYFIKYHRSAPERFFTLEAKGLQLIKSTNTIDVPEVINYSDEKGKAFLVLEWVSGSKHTQTDKRLGERLAALHQTKGKKHGFHEPTFIGTLQQPNGYYTRWLEYYRDRRLSSQLRLGIENNHIRGKRRSKLEKLLSQLDRWIPNNISPSHLHGDLWGGNWIVGQNGVPFLIDPSFLYGDRHFDLAFTEVFGGFSEAFYQAYEACYPTDRYYEDCKPLYQLYYLLVHLNLFGEIYGSDVDKIVNYYIGD